MLPLEAGVPLLITLILDVVMNIEGSALWPLAQSLQPLSLEDAPDKSISAIVSYLKGALLLLEN